MGGNDDIITERVKTMADTPPPPPPPPPPPGSPLKTPNNTPLMPRGESKSRVELNVTSSDNDSDRSSLLSPPLLLEIEEGTPAFEALKANADIRVSKLRKVGRSTRLQAGVRVLKSAARTASGQPGHAGDRRGAPAFVAPRSSVMSNGSALQAAGQPPPTIPEADDEGGSEMGGGRLEPTKARAEGDEGELADGGVEVYSMGGKSASTADEKSINVDDFGTDRNKVELPSTLLSSHPGSKYSSQRNVTHAALPAAIAAACLAGEEMDRRRSEVRINSRQKNVRLTSSLTLTHPSPLPGQRRNSIDHGMPSEISVAETERHANLGREKIDDEDLSDDGETDDTPARVHFKTEAEVDPIVVEIPGSREEWKEEELTDEEMASRRESMDKAKKKKMSIRKKRGSALDEDAFHFSGPKSVRKWVNRQRIKEENKNQRSYVKGKVIDEKHERYTMSIAVMFGMRTSIGRTNLAMSKNAHNERRWLDNDDMMAVEKYEFPPRGSDITPPHQLNHTFKFKDYSPLAFAYLRRMFGVNEYDFLLSVCGNANYIAFQSNAKSGQFFFYSPDGKYMIKTMTNTESKFLRRIMPHYFRHCAKNPNTLVAKFLGMYRVKLYHLKRNVKFMVMKSVYDTDKDLHQIFDVKGSSLGRDAGPGEDVKKDNDIRRVLPDGAFVLEPGLRERLRKQVERDCQWLGSMKIMDYSMLIGVHNIGLRNTKTPLKSVSQIRLVSNDDGDDRSNVSHDMSMHTLDRFLYVDDDDSFLDGVNPKGSSSKRVSYDTSSATSEEAVKTVRVLSPDTVDEESSKGSLKETDVLVEKAIEDMYWPFHRFYDIQGFRRMKPISDSLLATETKKGGEAKQTEEKKQNGRATVFDGLFVPHPQSLHAAGNDTPSFEKPLSYRKDEGFTVDTSAMDLPLKMSVAGAPHIVEYCDGKIIYIGIIDILQQFNIRKRVEARYRKTGTQGWDAASCVHPKLYADRFLRFFDEYTEGRPAPTNKSIGENASVASDIASNHSEISSRVQRKNV